MTETTLKEFAAKLIGLAIEEAKKMVEPRNFRIMRIDGEGQRGTCDFREDRVNISVNNGVVDEVWMG